MMPPVALVIPYYVLFQSTGLLGSLWATAISHSVFSIAIVIWMMKNFFDEIPPEIEEAAIVDGATNWQLFSRIALPISKAAVAASAIFAFLTSWNEFLFAVILSKSSTQTIPVAGVGLRRRSLCELGGTGGRDHRRHPAGICCSHSSASASFSSGLRRER